MKRKLLNAALFGAVLIAAPVSTFVSCADYDSDITDLRTENDKLNALVAEKEAAIQEQIKALDAQAKALEEAYKKADTELSNKLQKAIEDGDAQLRAELEDCKTNCKAEFEKVRGELADAKLELGKALEDAKKELADAHEKDVKKLLEADQKLQDAIDKAVADLKVADKGLQDNIDALKGYTDGELAKVNEQIVGVKTQLEQVKSELDGKIVVINGEIENLKKQIADNKAELQGLINANTTKITEVSNALDAHKTDFETYKTKVAGEFDAVKAELATKATKEEVGQLEETLRALITANANEITTLKGRMGTAEENIGKLQAAVAGLSDQVAKNTKAIADNAARILVLEGDLQDAVATLVAADEALQANIDAEESARVAADLLLQGLIDGLTTRVATNEGNIATNASEIAALKTKIENEIKPAIQTAQNRADAAYAYAEAVQNELHSDYWTSATVQQKLNELKQSIEQAQALVDQEQDRLFNAHVGEFNTFKSAYETWKAGVDTQLGNINATLTNHNQLLAGLRTDLDALAAKHDQEVSALRTDLTTLQNTVASNYTTLWNKIEADDATTLATAQQYAREQDAALKTAIYNEYIQPLQTSLSSLESKVEEYAKALSAEVKGFVLEPASYYEGIQAIEGTSYEYSKWDVTNKLIPTQGTDVTTYCPAVTAHYHINPSVATLSTDKNNYSFAVLDRVNRSGVNTELQPEVTAVAQNGGMLDVTLKLGKPAANKTPQTHQDPSEVTVMALQYNNPAAKTANQVVTSDYAVLFLNPLVDVALVDATDGHDIPAAHDPANGIFAEADYVAYDTEVPYDICAMVKTQFGGEDALWANELPEGFSLKFTEVDGDVMNFNTDEATGKVMPTLKDGQPATTACIGKNMIVRIDVMHGDEIAEVGFYKLTITGKAITETSDPTVTDDVRALTCIDDKIVLNKEMDIQKLWDLIVYKTGEDLETVKGKYDITFNEAGEVKQFDTYTGEGGRTLYKGIAGKGVITLNTNGKVQWVVRNNDPALNASIQKKGDKLVTYIRIRSKAAISSDTYNEFYLPVVWEPQDVEVWPADQTATWSYDKWDLQWQDNAGTGQNELRLYSDLTKVGTADYHYEIMGKAIKNNDNFKVTLDDPAHSFINHLEFEDFNHEKVAEADRPHFRFIEHPDPRARQMVVGDVTYNLTLNATGTTMYANGTEIATISRDGVVDLLNNPTSQKLLNAYEKNQLDYGQTLCARVGYTVKSCAGAVRVKNGDFDVRFVKPVTFKTDAITISDTDGIGGAKVIDFLGNLVCFNNNTFDVHTEYFDVFGATITIPDAKTWKTNYDGQDFVNTLEGTGMEGNFLVGTVTTPEGNTYNNIKYSNNTAVVSNFSVKVPVTLSYVWGATVVYEVELKIERTLDNSNRR